MQRINGHLTLEVNMTKNFFDPAFRAWEAEAKRSAQQTEDEKIRTAFVNGVLAGVIVSCITWTIICFVFMF